MFKSIVRTGMLLLCFALLAGCWDKKIGGDYAPTPFKTNLSIEEHIENITAQTNQRYKTSISEGRIRSFTVEIVYAFNGNPEYFLVEFDGFGAVEEAHLLGYIENDRYMTGLNGYDSPNRERSIYKENGITTEKKYYGARIFAVEKNGEIVGLNGKYLDLVIPKEDYEYLAYANRKLFPKKFSDWPDN